LRAWKRRHWSDVAKCAPGLRTGQPFDSRQAFAATTFYDQIETLFADCAGVQRGQGDEKSAECFMKSSTRWMRHSLVSHAIAAGMPTEIAQRNLGQALAGDDDGLCDDRAAAADEGGRGLLERPGGAARASDNCRHVFDLPSPSC
jgi:hypothetical protein